MTQPTTSQSDNGNFPWETIEFPGMTTIVVKASGLNTSRLREYMDCVFSTLPRFIGTLFTPTGPAFARYDTPFGEVIDVEVGFPIDPSALPSSDELEAIEPTPFGPIVLSELPATTIAFAKHQGPYDTLYQSWDALYKSIQESGKNPGLPYWEAYETMPTPETDPNELITGLAIPVN